MDHYKVLIVDDELKNRELMRQKVEELSDQLVVIDTCSNINDAYNSIVEKHPQIIFLDVSMPGGSGFDLLDRFDNLSCEVVFVTGYGDFALDALRASATDYLLKPINDSDLERAIKKVIDNLKHKREFDNLKILSENLKNPTKEEFKLAIPDLDTYHVITADKIIYCKGEQKYTRIYLENGEPLLSSYNIGKFDKLLGEKGFFRSHKSFLINLNKIRSFKPDGTITMKDDSEVMLSRRKKEAFKQLLLTM